MNIIPLILENGIFQLGDWFLGTQFIKQLKLQRKYNLLTSDDLSKIQQKKLLKILNHACNTCEAYKPFYENSSDPIVWLTQFPVINKTVVSEQYLSYLSKMFITKDLIKYETSGSSGIRSVVYVDKKEQSIFRAILINWWEWSGYYFGKPMLQTGMSPVRGCVKKIKDFVLSVEYLNAFDLTENKVLEKLEIMNKYHNVHFGGYASSLYVIAEIAEKNQIDIKFDAVISWGDKMFDHYQKKIEKVFKTKVFENYSCNEGLMIGQKVDIDYFYIYTPSVYLELLDENDQPVQDGEIGRVIVTKLDGYAMPLIRYDTGDLAIKLPLDKYPANRKFNFPLLQKVIGRNTDIVKTPDGKNLIVHTFTGIFEFYEEILQFRVVQRQVDKIEIEYIPSRSFQNEVLEKIEKDIRDKTKSSIGIEWKSVESIPTTGSGKPQLIKNFLIEQSLTDQS